MADLTVIFLTENNLPKHWTRYHRKILADCIGKNDLITISRKPIKNFGLNIIQTEERSIANIYNQILRGAKLAQTELIAIAEDDTLYVKSHFEYRPPRKGKNTFYYNMANWKIFNWGRPCYHNSLRIALNYVLVANRETVIAVLENRIKLNSPKYFGELGKYIRDREMEGRPCDIDFFSTCEPVININHDKGFDDYCHRHVKRMGNLRAYDIPLWGKAENLIKQFR